MAVPRGMLGRPTTLAVLTAHTPKFSPSKELASPAGLSQNFAGLFGGFSGSEAARFGQRRNWTFPRASINSAKGVNYSENSSNFGRISGKGRRGFFSMAAAASETLSPAEEAEYKIQDQIIVHQRAAAKLSHIEEARTLVYQTTLGTLSTISQKYDGWPFGSMVIYATDEDGSIILCISSLSPHTRDLEQNPKCSLLVPKDPADKSDTVITIIGEALMVSDQDVGTVRTSFLKRHPGAFWVDFGDFRFVRIQPKKVRYVSGLITGLAAVGDYSAEQYRAASVDPISQFGPPIAGHMNRDHADQTAEIVENSLGVKVESALIQDVDRYGFGVLAKRQGNPVKLRIPFPRPAEDRKAVKTLIIEMLAPNAN